MKRSIGYESKKDINELTRFLDDLPHKLKTEVSLYVYESRYENIQFFKNRGVSFILWMCPLLRPQIYNENQFFFNENEAISEIFFMIKGLGSFVLPRYKNTPYIVINGGSHFGVIDIVGSCNIQNIDIKEWFVKRVNLMRQFSVQSIVNSEVLCLNVQQLFQMENEFNDCF